MKKSAIFTSLDMMMALLRLYLFKIIFGNCPHNYFHFLNLGYNDIFRCKYCKKEISLKR
jgi:hypothetical protein